MSDWLYEDDELLKINRRWGRCETVVSFKDIEFCIDRNDLKELEKEIMNVIKKYWI